MSKQLISGDIKHLSGAVIISQLVFTSGITGKPGDAETQIRNTLTKLKSILEEAGTSFENVVKATVYLTNLEDREHYLNKIWRETFPKNSPARTCVQVCLSPETLVEIEMIATIP